MTTEKTNTNKEKDSSSVDWLEDRNGRPLVFKISHQQHRDLLGAQNKTEEKIVEVDE